MTIIRTRSQADIFSCDAKMQKRENFNAIRKCECDAKKRKKNRLTSLFSLKKGEKIIDRSLIRIALPAPVLRL
jgi:hypothetical protein